MQIHGTAVTVDGQRYTILFTSLSYRDWVFYLDAGVLYTPAAARYLFATYVTEAYVEAPTADTTRTYLTVDELLATLKSGPLQKILDLFIIKSGFNSPEAFEKLLTNANDSFKTHLGIYDLFLFLNLSADEYLKLLDAPAETRALMIAGLQIKRGLDVKKRVEDVERNAQHNIPLDLIHSDAEYEATLQQNGYSRTGTPAQKHRLPAEAEAVINEAFPNATFMVAEVSLPP